MKPVQMIGISSHASAIETGSSNIRFGTNIRGRTNIAGSRKRSIVKSKKLYSSLATATYSKWIHTRNVIG